MLKVMIKFAYVVPKEEAGFTKYIEVTLNIHNSGVIMDRVMKFVQNLNLTIWPNVISNIFGYIFSLLALQKFRWAAQSITLEIPATTQFLMWLLVMDRNAFALNAATDGGVIHDSGFLSSKCVQICKFETFPAQFKETQFSTTPWPKMLYLFFDTCWAKKDIRHFLWKAYITLYTNVLYTKLE